MGDKERRTMGKIIAVCLSEKKGVQKKSVDEGIFIEDFGIQVNGIDK